MRLCVLIQSLNLQALILKRHYRVCSSWSGFFGLWFTLIWWIEGACFERAWIIAVEYEVSWNSWKKWSMSYLMQTFRSFLWKLLWFVDLILKLCFRFLPLREICESSGSWLRWWCVRVVLHLCLRSLVHHFAVAGSYLLLLMKAKTLTASASLLSLQGPLSLVLPLELALAGEQQ